MPEASIGLVLRSVRIKKNLTQQGMAELIGVDRTVISKIENDVKGQKLSTLRKYFNALDCEIELVVTDKNTNNIINMTKI